MSSAPTAAALSISPSSSITDRVASPAAMARALVPKVESWTSMRSMDEYTRWKTVDVPEGGADGDEPAGQGLGDGHQVGLDPVVLVAEEPAGPAQPGLHLVADQQGPVPVQQGGRRGQEAVRHHLDALALDRLDDQGGDVAGGQLPAEGVEVAEGHLGARAAAGRSRPETPWRR